MRHYHRMLMESLSLVENEYADIADEDEFGGKKLIERLEIDGHTVEFYENEHTYQVVIDGQVQEAEHFELADDESTSLETLQSVYTGLAKMLPPSWANAAKRDLTDVTLTLNYIRNYIEKGDEDLAAMYKETLRRQLTSSIRHYLRIISSEEGR